MIEHKSDCASLTMTLACDPQKPAPCDCGAEKIYTAKWAIPEPMKLQIYNAEPSEWGRIDADLKLIHLDMDLCAKGPANIYTALAIGVWNAAIEEVQERLMNMHRYVGGEHRVYKKAAERIKELKK